ncbi:FtsX-like permease family protein [Muricauda sp. JGD-17]|uniref:FtsX-like permease family protein n=1 Tax=Flagellimonas ochracea TaxID=2696472 RepID=A0A964TFY2_9FLAO|nr:ABC transporter permease [Allomuricauda ochracea]NAY93331.1 FtsX-like permease family protein [Allomuricauda ochracea]
MFKNHIKIAWRSLKKQPFFTFLNTFGLAIGMTGALLISLFIYDELSFDKMFADAHRIYRIDADIKFGGAEIDASQTSAPMAGTLQRDFPQVESTVRFRDQGSMLLKKSGTVANTKELRATFVDSTFFDFFGVKLLFGDTKTALTQPNTLVLTKTAAEKHFGVKNAIGQSLILDNTDTYTVTGVIDDLPKNSFLRDHSVFMAMAGLADSREDLWGNTNYYTFIKLIPTAKIEDFQAPLQSILEKYLLPWAQQVFPGLTMESFAASGNYYRYHSMPLTDIHLYSNRQSEMSANSSIQNVYILSFIALFLIVLASVNFMNLSTAHSLKRAKEVGIRKTLGSKKLDLVSQFLTESGLISFISLLLALVLTLLVLPLFNDLSGKSISLPYESPFFWLILLVATILLGLFSGSYPAFFMSRFMPVKTLKGGEQKYAGGVSIRNALVIFQFAISVFLIIATLVVYQQLDFIQGKDLGYTKDQIVLIDDTFAAGNQVDTFKEEVVKLGKVQSATLSSFLPTPSARSNTSFFKEGSREQENAIQMEIWSVDEDYIPTLDMELVAGRNFDDRFGTDSAAVIINEAALPVLGIGANEVLGTRISQDIESEEAEYYTVIGVVRNFHYESLREHIGALCLLMRRSTGNMAVKLSAGDFPKTIVNIKTIWEELAPGQPFNYRFMDDSFNTVYETERQLGKIFMVFSVLSILIACLGLFGLAAFNAQKRTKEIGIRKVLGASIEQITFRLTTDFVKMVSVAILISLPLGWFAMNKWLQDFSYRIQIAWWVLALAGFLALTIAVLTVSYQSIKAAIVNPVKSLRTE